MHPSLRISLASLAFWVAPVAQSTPTPTSPTQPTASASPRARPALERQRWTTDLTAALAQAKAERKLVFAYFTRSFAA